MMKNSLLIIVMLIVNSVLFSQNIKVVNTKKIDLREAESYYPKFSKDDEKIVFTESNYKGLYAYNLKTNQKDIITNEYGAGYNPIILDDESILYRSTVIKKGKKYHSINSFNYKNNSSEKIETDKRGLKIPFQMPSRDLVLVEQGKALKKEARGSRLAKSSSDSKAIFVEDENLIMIHDTEEKIMNPLGKGSYVWESISPDGQFVLFTFGGQGSFVADLNGNIIVNIEEAHYPRFSPNGKYISYMVDKDDGYKYTSSDIHVYSLEQKKTYKITNTDDKIEMYPEWSNDGNKLVYNTTDGEIFITTLKFEN